MASQFAKKFPKTIANTAKKAEEYARGIFTGGTLFEELGFYYVGPIDGHNLSHLIPVLKNLKESELPGPVLLHAVTVKGKGYEPAEKSTHRYHGVASFDVSSGEQNKGTSNAPAYTKVFAENLIKHANVDDKIVGLTGAMPSLFGRTTW